MQEGAEAREVLELANSGNKEAVGVVAEAMEYLALGLKIPLYCWI